LDCGLEQIGKREVAAISTASASGSRYSETRRERRTAGISGSERLSSSIHFGSSSSGGRSGSGK